ncbi:MAG TPA: hypothetical protein VFG50_04855 [Rhodothermales bacterium]|nr:hypothetical protein [Rhodothermales bacterium]
MSDPSVQYVANTEGEITAVLVPIEVWHEIASELETEHLLGTPVMQERLLRALGEEGGTPLEEVLGHLGVTEDEIATGDSTT